MAAKKSGPYPATAVGWRQKSQISPCVTTDASAVLHNVSGIKWSVCPGRHADYLLAVSPGRRAHNEPPARKIDTFRASSLFVFEVLFRLNSASQRRFFANFPPNTEHTHGHRPDMKQLEAFQPPVSSSNLWLHPPLMIYSPSCVLSWTMLKRRSSPE